MTTARFHLFVVLTVVGAAATLALLGIGYARLGGLNGNIESTRARGESDHLLATEIWTCPMHPEVRESAPGTCPKCGMDLVKENAAPAETPETGGAPPRVAVELDTRRRQLIGVRTARAERTAIAREIRAVGLVRYDETRLFDVNLKVDGWVQTLHVDSTGQPVRRGQPLLELYSPDLHATQQEYLLALATRDAVAGSEIASARAQADRLVESARARLTLWDLPENTLDSLERTRKAGSTVTLTSPVTGFVIEKPVVEGMRVMPGQTLYKVADLSTVWVEADIFESDAPFLKVGLPATVTVDAWPGESLRGRAAHVYPYVEERTRTLKVRFVIPNTRQRLKPGMYANVTLAASLGTGVTVPSDALLDAGRQQLVFVAEGDGYYQPRPVRIGHRLGDRVQIVSGLEEGEQVAAGAAFFLDSESQLRAAAAGWDRAGQEPARSETTQPTSGIILTTVPDPPRSGENTFRVTVTDQAQQPVTDLRVQVRLYMPAMPSMNMPAMSSEATLTHTGGGVYEGRGLVPMAGRWDVTITLTRGGSRVAARHTTLVAR